MCHLRSHQIYIQEFQRVYQINSIKKQLNEALTENLKLKSENELLKRKCQSLEKNMFELLWKTLPKQNEYNDLKANYHFETEHQIGKYQMETLLGQGSFGEVKLCTDSFSKEKFAVKIFRKRNTLNVSSLHQTQNEINVLKEVKHENIIQFVDVIHSPDHIYLFTQVGATDLFDYTQVKKGILTDNIAKEIMIGIISPIVYLHEIGICHRELKPENILLVPSGDDKSLCKPSRFNIRICDFGSCSRDSGNMNHEELTDMCGSHGFFAPGMILGGGTYNGKKADVWSLGCIMIAMLMKSDDLWQRWMDGYDYYRKDGERFRSELTTVIDTVFH